MRFIEESAAQWLMLMSSHLVSAAMGYEWRPHQDEEEYGLPGILDEIHPDNNELNNWANTAVVIAKYIARLLMVSTTPMIEEE